MINFSNTYHFIVQIVSAVSDKPAPKWHVKTKQAVNAFHLDDKDIFFPISKSNFRVMFRDVFELK